MNIIQVPLSDLGVAESNVRKTGGKDISDLVASIKAHGLLQNLTVSPGVNGVKYRVIAGGRRLRALQELAKSKALPADWPVPCNVVDEAAAAEASLTENVSRSQMHPADEFEAFHKLATGPEKATAGDIAARFGKSELYVRQRMKLANVAPEIMKEYRAGKATLEQLMALALTDDQDLQRRVWKAARAEYQRRPAELRQVITKHEISTGDALGAFVGVEAYEKASGQVRRDLFDDDGTAYMSDIELVHKLALEKLQRTADKIAKEGWKWVEARVEFDWSEENKFGRIYPNYKGSKEVWTDQDKRQAGVVVTIAHNGQTKIARGLVRPEDRQAAQKSSKGKVNGGPKTFARKPGDLTFASLQRLQAECGALVAAHVAKAPDTALKLIAAELADDVFYTGYEHPRTWAHIGRQGTNRMPGNIAKEMEKNAAVAGMAAIEADWKKKLPKKRSEARAWIFEQDSATVLQLLAFLIAREIDVVDIAPDRKGGIVELAAAAKVDLASVWKPTAEWLATLPKSTVIAMAKDAGVKDVDLAKLSKQPKAKLASEALPFFPAGWLPKPLRPAGTKPAANKKAPAKKAKRKA